MAIVALQAASTGLSALNTSLDVIANNLANVNTDGFKSSRVNFQDLLYMERAQPGVENANGDQRPTGLYVGLGTKVSGTQLNFQQGGLRSSDRPLDMAIDGQGFFKVQVENDLSEGGIAYTRSGNFVVNSEGSIVLANDTGRLIDPNITIPIEATGVTITRDGVVSAAIPGQADAQQLGTIELATFINPAGLRQIGENLYAPSAASGGANTGNPLEGGRGGILQGFIEASNVDPVTELVDLIRTQRAFELNSQSIKAADEVLRTISNIRQG